MVLSHAEKRARMMQPTRKDAFLMGLGAVLYAVIAWLTYLFPVGDLLLRPAAGVVILFGMLFGPAVGFMTGFLGDLLTVVFQGDVWLHWSLGHGIMGLVVGLLWLWSDIDARQPLTGTEAVKVVVFTAAGSFLGMFFAACIDLLSGTPFRIALWAWGLPAALANTFFGALFALAGLFLYKNVGTDQLLPRRNSLRMR